MIVIEKSNRADVVTLTLNRPEKRNALNRQLVDELAGVIEDLSGDESVRIIVLTGSGSVFSAGADLEALEEMRTASYETNLEDSQKLADLFTAIQTCSQVVIARVNGHAIAGGCGLVTACDFAISDSRARFGFTEVRLGFIPAIVMTLLKNRIPDRKLRNLLLRGSLISAAEAQELGLLNRVVDGARLDKAVHSLADEIVRETSPQAVAATKRLFFDLNLLTGQAALTHAVEQNARMRGTPDCLAGIRAFLNREDPPWKKDFDGE